MVSGNKSLLGVLNQRLRVQQYFRNMAAAAAAAGPSRVAMIKRIKQREAFTEPPPMLEAMREVITNAYAGREITWLTKKRSSGKNRLLLPRKIEEVLTETEKWYLKKHTDNKIRVFVVDDHLKEAPQFRLTLQYRPDINKFVFTKEWMDFVCRNQMEEGKHQLQIWSFRSNHILCFAISSKVLR